MKHRIMALACLAALIFVGCSQATEDSIYESSRVEIVNMGTDSLSFEEKYDECSQKYPGKTILVWLTEWQPKYEQQLNDYLYSNEYDYVVCFKNILDYENGDSYYQIASDMINNGEQIDLIDSFGVMFGQEAISNNYYYYSEHGMFEALDVYLSDNKYSEYFNMMPQKYWDSYKYKGRIYGIDNSFSSLYADNGYAISNKVFEETDFTPEDFQKPPFELTQQFKLCHQILNRKTELDSHFFTSNFYYANYIDEGIAIVENKAVNVYNTDEALDFYKNLNTMQNEEYVILDPSALSESEMPIINSISSAASFTTTVVNDYFDITKVFYQSNNYIKNPTRAIGISSKSQNKAMAFDFLINVTFNSEMNNVITYGMEEVNYMIDENGYVQMLADKTNVEYSPDIIYNNPMVSLSCLTAPDEIYSRDFYSAYETAEYLDGFGFLFDGTAIKDTYVNVVDTIMDFNPSSDNIEAYLNEFNQKLYNAGLQDIIDEANRQLEVYNNEKNN